MKTSPAPYTACADLNAEIEIPADGTLSRTIYQDDHIKVVLFGFDTGQELSGHAASVPAIIEVLRGALVLRLGDEEMIARAGAWVHMRAGLEHAVRALEPTVMLLSMLKGMAAP